MPSIKKELELAKSIGELNKLAQIEDKISKNGNPKPWVNSAEKVYKKAEEYDLLGDEENAYVLYMRFFNIMQEVSKTTKYQNDKRFYNSLVGKKTLKAIERAETLQKSLAVRYEKLEEKTKAEAIVKEKKEKEKENNEKANMKNINGMSSTMQDIDDLLSGKKISPQMSADGHTRLDVNHSSRPTISPVALYELLENDPNDVLILDTRSKREYGSSRINYLCCINIPEDLLKTSVNVASIERKLPKPTWEQWIERGRRGHVVILDQNTNFAEVKPESKIQCLKDAIYLYDKSKTLKSEPLFLDGGYEAWLWHYPSLVTNPKLPEVLPSQNITEFSLDLLSYPELPKLPEPTQPQPQPQPQPNRSTNGHGAPPTTPNTQTSPTGAINPAERQQATSTRQISQNVPVAGKPTNPATSPNSAKMARPQNLENHTPNVPVAPQQPYPSQGVPNRPSPNAKPNANASKVVANNDTHQVPPSLPQQSALINAPSVSNHALKPANQVTPSQTLPNKSNTLQTSIAGQSAHARNSSHTSTTPPNNQVGQSLPHNASSQPKVPTVAPQSSTNNMTNKTPPVGGPSLAPIPPPQSTSPVPRPQQPPQHPSGPVTSHLPYTVHGQSHHAPHQPQVPVPTIPPTHPQASMAQQLRPTVSGILPKMTARNPSSQPNFPASTSPAPQGIPTSTTVPQPSNTRVPQTPAQRPTAIPSVPQTFTGSRTGMTHGLPPGWERVLDRKTGRYYFQDHNTKTTHWNPPESLTQTMNRSIMGHNTPTAKEAEPKKPSLKRSLSSPNLAKIGDEEIKPSAPITNSRPSVNRRTKPLTESQLANLSPSHGGQGKALTGLRNLGNSCYMNSVLQCLLATAPLAKYMVNSYYLDDINKTNPLGTGGRIAEELAVLTRVAHSGNYRSVSPYEFKRTIGRFAPEFGGTKQQDSQEFLLVLLDQFHEDTNRVLKKAYIEEKSNEGLPDSMAARLAWDNHKKRNQSLIVELFQGQFKSTLTCSVCSKQSVTFEAFMSLTLPIPTNASCQIEDCIRLFTTREKVSKDNKWFCPRCKQHREAWKTMEIWKLPPILIVHFNRFKRDFDGSWLEKRQTNVHFPCTNLDLSKFVLGPNKTLRYSLYGVSNHYGSMQSGHYTAFCKNIYNSKWHKFDDSDVTSMSESSVKSSAAYILFYTSMEFTKP